MGLLAAIFSVLIAFTSGYLCGFRDRDQTSPKTTTHKNSHQDNLRLYEAGYQDGFRDATNNVDNYGDSPMIMN